MIDLQISSIDEPLLEAPDAASLAFSLVGRAQTMGFLPAQHKRRIELDREFLVSLANALRGHGLASIATAELARAAQAEPVNQVDLVEALRAILEAVDASPHPDGEWAPARDLLGDELLARVLQISGSSLRRYAAGDRRTPDDVAWRLHIVARLLAALIGSYNEYGVRRWFERPRSGLGGRTPAEILEDAQVEDDERVKRLISLAEELTGAGAAT